MELERGNICGRLGGIICPGEYKVLACPERMQRSRQIEKENQRATS